MNEYDNELNEIQKQYKDKLIAKWNNDKNIKCYVVKDFKIIIENEKYIIVDKCYNCKIVKPIYNFYKKNIKVDSLSLESGKELYRKSCISCTKKEHIKYNKNHEEIIRSLIYQNNGDLTKEWFKIQLEIQKNKCHITNLPIILDKGYYYSASVQNNGEGNIHYQSNCVLIMKCLQVQEHKIPNLKEAWKHILMTMKKEEELKSDTSLFLNEINKRFRYTIKESGIKEIYRSKEYTNQCRKLHLKTILNDLVERYYYIDGKSKGRKDEKRIKLKKEDILKKINNQEGRCYLTGVPFSLNRDDPNYWSLERLDNTKNHTIENTVLICRIMNGVCQITKDIIKKIYDEYKINLK